MSNVKTARGSARKLRRAAMFHEDGCPARWAVWLPVWKACQCKQILEEERMDEYFKYLLSDMENI